MMTRGRRCPTRHKASCRKCLAATQSRWGESMKSMVLPSESSARYKIGPLAGNANVGLIHLPGPIGIPDMSPYSLVQDGSVSQYPASNCGMIDTQTALCHQLFQVPITERVSEIPAHALHDHLVLKVPSLEYGWSSPSHSAYLSNSVPLLRHYHRERAKQGREGS